MTVTESREFQSKLHAFYRDPNEAQEISVIIVVKTFAVWILLHCTNIELLLICTCFAHDLKSIFLLSKRWC